VVKFIAKESDDFKPHSSDVREIGFAFSFPVLQTSVRSGVVIHWTKGFKIDDAVITFFHAKFLHAFPTKNLQF
jgi:hexokinase